MWIHKYSLPRWSKAPLTLSLFLTLWPTKRPREKYSGSQSLPSAGQVFSHWATSWHTLQFLIQHSTPWLSVKLCYVHSQGLPCSLKLPSGAVATWLWLVTSWQRAVYRQNAPGHLGEILHMLSFIPHKTMWIFPDSRQEAQKKQIAQNKSMENSSVEKNATTKKCSLNLSYEI